MKHSALAWVTGIGAVGLGLIACGTSSGGSGFNNNDPNQNNPNADGGPGSNPNCGFGCTSGGSDAGSVVIDPANAIVYIDTATTPATPGTQTFKITDSSGKDITSTATFNIDDATLGAFNGSTFTSVGALGTGAVSYTHLRVNHAKPPFPACKYTTRWAVHSGSELGVDDAGVPPLDVGSPLDVDDDEPEGDDEEGDDGFDDDEFGSEFPSGVDAAAPPHAAMKMVTNAIDDGART